MRQFLALKVPELNLSDLRFQKLNLNFGKRKIQYHWVPQEQLYIPLLEFAQMGQARLMGYRQRLKSIFTGMEAFDLKLKGLWAYPHQHDADMLWVNVQNSKQLRFIQEESLRVLDLDEDALARPYLPLIYLNERSDVADLISPFKNMDFGLVKIQEVKIIEKLEFPLGVRMMCSFSLREQSQGNEMQDRL